MTFSFTMSESDLNDAISHNSGVQGAMDKFIAKADGLARADLARHRDQGHSFIEKEKADTDRLLILNDTRGQAAAMSIETGRQASPEDNDPGMTGLGILHKAMGAAMRSTYPRRSRRSARRNGTRLQGRGR